MLYLLVFRPFPLWFQRLEVWSLYYSTTKCNFPKEHDDQTNRINKPWMDECEFPNRQKVYVLGDNQQRLTCNIKCHHFYVFLKNNDSINRERQVLIWQLFIRIIFRKKMFNFGNQGENYYFRHLNSYLDQMFVFCLGTYKIHSFRKTANLLEVNI